MAAFEYEALDIAGKKTRGLLSADSEQAARRELRRRRLAPLSVQRADEARTPTGLFSRLARPHALSQRELMAVTRQLATLISAGMPVEEAVGLVGSQSASKSTNRVLMTVRAKVTEGERLSEAMASHPHSFPAVFRAMVAAGESAGGLGQVLDRLADYLEKTDALKRKIATALIYPAVLGVVAMGVVGVLLVFIVPRISEQFDSMGLALPFITRLMISISGFLQVSWPILLAALAGLIIAYNIAIQRDNVRRSVDQFRLSLPGIGGFIRKLESARFSRTMGILIASGAVLPDALRAARKASANLPFQDVFSDVIEQVETGNGLAETLRTSRHFPSIMVYMVAAGERSGRLAEMFTRAAEHLEKDIDGAVNIGLSLLEPGIIIVMGVIVATIVLSILLPILQLNTAALV